MARIHGTPHADTLVGIEFQDNWISGLGGDDRLIGRDGNDHLYGGAGNDELQGREGDDYLNGGIGDDRLLGDEGINVLLGRRGDDTLTANGTAADSTNIMHGDRGDDVLSLVGSGYARMEGATGNDWLGVYCGRDLVNQNAEIVTGKGSDTVSFHSADAALFSQAHVQDFTPGQDHIVLFAEEQVAQPPFEFPRTFGTAALFAQMDTDQNGILDGTDAGTAFAHAFKLGEPEHGIGIIINDDALVIQLPPGHDALAAADFLT